MNFKSVNKLFEASFRENIYKSKAELINAFGGEFSEVIIGGAAFNKEVEAFFKKIEVMSEAFEEKLTT